MAMNNLQMGLIGQKGYTAWHTTALNATGMKKEVMKDGEVKWSFFYCFAFFLINLGAYL